MKNNFPAENLAPVLEDLGIHFDKTDNTIQRKSLEADSLTIDPNDSSCVIAKISSINVDRSGDVLIPGGCETGEYENNPVVFTNHNYSQLPVAKMVKIQKTENAVYGKYQFSETEEAQAVLKLVKEGILKANSVGFITLESLKRGTAAFSAYVNSHFNGVIDKACKQIITKWQLLENSLVGIGCNKDALVLAISKGLVSETPAEPVVTPVVPVESIPEKIEEIAQDIQKVTEDVKETIQDIKEVIEVVVEEVKPVIERFVRLVHPPKEEIKKSMVVELEKKRLGKIK